MVDRVFSSSNLRKGTASIVALNVMDSCLSCLVRLAFSPQNAPHFVIFISELADRENYAPDNSGSLQRLTTREEIIAQYVALGLSNKEIAAKLGISHYTVQNHLKNIFSKTGLDSRARLAALIKCLDRSSS